MLLLQAALETSQETKKHTGSDAVSLADAKEFRVDAAILAILSEVCFSRFWVFQGFSWWKIKFSR